MCNAAHTCAGPSTLRAPITLQSCKFERNIRLKKKNKRPGEKIRLTALIMSDKDTQTHATHPHTQRHMHARERPRRHTLTCWRKSSQERKWGNGGGVGCNSPRLGRAEAESPRKTEEDEEMLLEGEDKPVGETRERGHKGRCAARKQKADSRQICRNTHSERHHNREMNMQSHARPHAHAHTHTALPASHTQHSPLHSNLWAHGVTITNNHLTENILLVCLKCF